MILLSNAVTAVDYAIMALAPNLWWLFAGRVLSGIATGLSWLCYFRALEIGPVSGVVSVDKLSVVLVVVLSMLLVGERPTWHVGLGSALVALGAILVSLPMSS